jgi:hypothetical protein
VGTSNGTALGAGFSTVETILAFRRATAGATPSLSFAAGAVAFAAALLERAAGAAGNLGGVPSAEDSGAANRVPEASSPAAGDLAAAAGLAAFFAAFFKDGVFLFIIPARVKGPDWGSQPATIVGRARPRRQSEIHASRNDRLPKCRNPPLMTLIVTYATQCQKNGHSGFRRTAAPQF